MSSKRSSIVGLAAAAAVVAAGIVGGARIAAAFGTGPPAADRLLWNRPFHLERKPTEPYALTTSRWLDIPWLYEDHDLVAELELGADTLVQVLLRRVEPRTSGSELPQFHGRFTVLNLSAAGPGPAWQSRDDAVLHPATGGVELAPGLPVTLWIQARGRRLRANVAGRWLDEQLAIDGYGATALLVRRGAATVRSLRIEPLPTDPPAGWPGWVVGAAAGVVVAAVGILARANVVALMLVALLLCGGAFAVADAVTAVLPPLARAGAAPALALLLAPVPLALAFVLPLRWLLRAALAAVAAAGAVVVVRGAQAAERERFATSPEVDALFGPRAGEGLAQALAQRLRGDFGQQTPDPEAEVALLLGGKLLYERGAAPEDRVQAMLQGELRSRVGPAADVAALPTVDGWSSQQWRLFLQFFTGFAPRWLVFGVPRDDAAPGPDGVPRSSPAQLAETLQQVRAWCEAHATRLILLADSELPPELRAVVRAAATGEVRLCEIQPAQSAVDVARMLAEAMAGS